ncbi:hypothetical protein ACFY6U_25490 [Streptomyces sp. NPDC013157]|uniref:hypothetical protein n=1 Tax=Streptomyces sp. NPDC013157 TaxID=3364861 RepID=UPI0036916500
MRDFYTRVLGLTVTDEDEELGIAFLSAQPEREQFGPVLPVMAYDDVEDALARA